ncbi:hypothetical protein T01_4582 [Trichinella spiralis]|uniref:Uncharacterized protein n=1 Tax=Trichinella spiralis TaxID=6334 RepID=A0A0V1BZG4_TRISP|nr:hypothetical protein T01_4582 [Trichinella spiralis]
MGAVDLSSMLKGLHNIFSTKDKRYRRVFFWVFGTATTKAWLPYRRHETFTADTSKMLDLLAFTASLSWSFCLADKPVPKKSFFLTAILYYFVMRA